MQRCGRPLPVPGGLREAVLPERRRGHDRLGQQPRLLRDDGSDVLCAPADPSASGFVPDVRWRGPRRRRGLRRRGRRGVPPGSGELVRGRLGRLLPLLRRRGQQRRHRCLHQVKRQPLQGPELRARQGLQEYGQRLRLVAARCSPKHNAFKLSIRDRSRSCMKVRPNSGQSCRSLRTDADDINKPCPLKIK